MNLPQKTLAAAIVLLILAPVVLAQDAPPPPKLYRWVGADGKAHYSDDLPPEALTQAREEMSKNTGMTIKQVDRAQTPEERAAAQTKADAEAKAQAVIDKSKNDDAVLLASYPSEAELKRAYDDRIQQIADSLKTTHLGLDSEQQSMSSLLIAASNMELSDKPVNAQLVASIKSTRGQVLDQQQLESQEEAQAASLRLESAATLKHYRELHTAAEAARSAPATPPHD